jgi:hypothetical protein
MAQPESIAELFGWRKKVRKEAEPASSESGLEEVPIETVLYMKFVGYAVDTRGEKTYFIKNCNTGLLVPLRMNMTSGGWKLIEISDEGITADWEDRKCLILFNNNFTYLPGEKGE